jgi:hypothetical protein
MIPEDERESLAERHGRSPEDLDAHIRDLLRALVAPEVPESLDARVLGAFRQRARPSRWWRRLMDASVRVPLPLAALAGVALLACLWLVRASWTTPGAAPEPTPILTVVTHTDLGGFVPVSARSVAVIPAEGPHR